MVIARKDYRYVNLFRAAFNGRAAAGHRRIHGINQFDQANVIKSLQTAITSNSCRIAFNQDNTIHRGPIDDTHVVMEIKKIKDLRDSKGVLIGYSILLSYGNPYSSDPGKMHTVTGKTEKLKINKKENLVVGAHMVIGISENHGKYPGTFKCVLEEMPGISRGKVLFAIEEVGNNTIPIIDRPEYSYKDKKRVVKGRADLRVSAYAEKSESLKNDLNTKDLLSIEFLGEPNRTDTMGVDGIEEVREVLTLKVKPGYRNGTLGERVIRSAMQKAKSFGYRMKADFQFEEKDETKRRTREIDIDKTQLEDQLFSKTVRIEKPSDFESIYEDFDQDVLNILRDKLLDKGLWSG